jgi:hypothetical protein
MSNVIDFQSDAMECLRMAERANVVEEKAALVALARAWMLLSEQLKRLHDGSGSEPSGPSALN